VVARRVFVVLPGIFETTIAGRGRKTGAHAWGVQGKEFGLV